MGEGLARQGSNVGREEGQMGRNVQEQTLVALHAPARPIVPPAGLLLRAEAPRALLCVSRVHFATHATHGKRAHGGVGDSHDCD